MIYCGGAINNLLLDTWWRACQSENFVEILSDDEIAQGYRVKPGQPKRGGRPFVENALHFNLRKDKRRSQAVESNLTGLFRVVGRALRSWSDEILREPDRLNGNSSS